jgi:hypothetical protein
MSPELTGLTRDLVNTQRASKSPLPQTNCVLFIVRIGNTLRRKDVSRFDDWFVGGQFFVRPRNGHTVRESQRLSEQTPGKLL